MSIRAKFYLTLELIHMENCFKLLTAMFVYLKGYWLIETVMFTKMTLTR
jgi:cell division protein FtsI/penicillin-binding protein 2